MLAEHIAARNVTAGYEQLARSVPRSRLRRELDRAAAIAIGPGDRPDDAIFHTNHALSSPDNVYLRANNRLWIMKTRNWNSLVQTLQARPEPAPVAVPERQLRRHSPASRLLGESATRRPLAEHDDDDYDAPKGLPPAGPQRLGSKARRYTQFSVSSEGFSPTGPTTEGLAPGLYRARQDNMGNVHFLPDSLNSDSLLRFEDKRYTDVTGQINKFWGLRERYESLGMIHKRGMLLYGQPGTGKSCLLKLVMEDAVARGNIVLIAEDTGVIAMAVGPLREVEPDRQVLAILEDVDDMSEHRLLQLFDGDSTADNILYLGTTNYVERLSPRVLRPGRFDLKVEIGPPPDAGRRAFFEGKLGPANLDLSGIEKWVEMTKGFSFGQLREFLVRIHCFEETPEVAAHGLVNGGFVCESADSPASRLLIG